MNIFKIGLKLLFITFAEMIIVLLSSSFMHSFASSGTLDNISHAFGHKTMDIHPFIWLILLIELLASIGLVIRGIMLLRKK